MTRSRWLAHNPRATALEYADVLRVARGVAGEEIRRGAAAVVLAGSWARGDAHRDSDVDLWAVGRARGQDLRVVEGRIVSVARKTVADLRGELRSPRLAGCVVPAWRECRILADPRGVARRLKRRAARFRWAPLRAQCDRYVASAFTEWAEEAVKLTRLLAEGRNESAAVQRNLLVDAMAGLVAVELRLFYDENNLWERVGARMGPAWHRQQRRALGFGVGSFEESCAAALELYRSTAARLGPRLSPAQRRVVERARS